MSDTNHAPDAAIADAPGPTPVAEISEEQKVADAAAAFKSEPVAPAVEAAAQEEVLATAGDEAADDEEADEDESDEEESETE